MTQRSPGIRTRIARPLALVIGAGLLLLGAAPAAHAADKVAWANFSGSSISLADQAGGNGFNLDTTGATVSQPQGMAFDSATGRIYWSNFSGASAVSFANANGTGGGGVLSTTGATVNGPAGLAIDPVAGRVYWSNHSGNSISYANLNGSGGGDLDTTGATVNLPGGVAVDPAAGRIYWDNNGDDSHPISYAKLDGTGGGGDLNTTGATADSSYGVAIDKATGKIYWANFSGDSISYANLNDSGGGDLDTTGASVNHPAGVAIDASAGKIWWANYGNDAISYANLNGTGGGGFINTSGATPDGSNFPILLEKAVNTAAPAITGTPAVGHSLSCSNGGWASDLLGANLYRAPESYAYQWLRDDAEIPGATASTYEVQTADAGHQIKCRVTAQNVAGGTDATSDADAIQALRPAVDRIFWANFNDSTISFADLTGGNGDELDTTGATDLAPQGLAIDSAAAKIYWANGSGLHGVSYANLDGTGGGGDLPTSAGTVSGPIGLAIDPAAGPAGRVYWGNANDNTIAYANLDGSGGDLLDTTGATVNSPSAVAVDPAAGRIYWSNNGDDSHPISYANLNGTGGGGDLNASGATASGVYGMAIDKAADKVYVTGYSNDVISYANLNGSGGGDLNTGSATVDCPTGGAIDPGAGKLWWANYCGGTSAKISFASLSGGSGGDLATTGAAVNGPNYVALLEKPSNTTAPAISGTPAAGHDLSCTQGSWAADLLGGNFYRAPVSYAYQWLKDNVAISGETSSTYAAQAGDVGHAFKCRVTATNLGGNTAATSTAKTIQTAPQNLTAPSISGTPAAGHTLTCNNGGWSGSMPQTHAYRWLRNGVGIVGATSATYAVKAADTGHALNCRVTAANGAGSATANSAAVTIKTPPKNTVAPKITGTPKVGNTLTCAKGTWTGSAPITYKYQWLRNGSPIAVATAASHVAKAADQNKFLSCKVTATNAAGSASKTSATVKVT
jgi:DNA-binding beta-propeller fold protein YncE